VWMPISFNVTKTQFSFLAFLAVLFGKSCFAFAVSRVQVKTSLGSFVMDLETSKAPATCAQFLKVVQSGFYAKKIFHRVIPDFVIQGGGFDLKLVNRAILSDENIQKFSFVKIKNESFNGLKNKRGSVAMARSKDPETALAQFFVNLKDNPTLDASGSKGSKLGYTVFAQVSEGMEVVDKIAGVYTVQMGSMADVPKVPILLEDVKILNLK
jgi:peptidyl-prolyl cis-trans isomerase B (cyclophilin B)